MYVDEFPEVSDSFACPGDSRWDTLYTVFTKHCLTHPSPYMKTAPGLPDIPPAASLLPVRLNFAEQLDFAIRALGGGISREPSLERPLSRRKRTPRRLWWSHVLRVARRGLGSLPGGKCLRSSCRRKKCS